MAYFRKHKVEFLVIYLLTLAVFYQVKDFDFLSNWDDDNYIIRNPDIAEVSWENIKKIFTTFYISNYQPLTMVVYMFELAVFGLKPAAFHIVNVLFHLLNIFLVFRISEKLFSKKWVPFIVAVLFAIHPTRLESVVWIAELKDVQYALFYLLAIDSYIDYVSSKKRKLLWRVLLFFVLSLLSKSMAITLPAILLLISWYKGEKFYKGLIIRILPFGVLSLIFGGLALYTQSQKAMEVAVKTNMIERFFLVCYAIWLYIEKLFVPLNLSGIHYYPPRVDGNFPLKVYLSPVLLMITGFFLWKIKRYRKQILFGLLFFIFAVSIVVQIVPFGYAIIAERYTYIPYLGFFFIIAVVLNDILEGEICLSYRKIVKPLSVIFLGWLVVVSFQRMKVWQNSILFFGDVIKKYPYSDHAFWLYGNVLKDYKKYGQAIKSYNEAIRLNPDYAMAYFNRGVAKAQLKQYDKALRDYQKTMMFDSLYYPVYNNTANIYVTKKEYDKALVYLEKTLRINPEYLPAKMTKADVLTLMKRYDEALEMYNEVLRQKPDNANMYYNRAVVLYHLKRINDACKDWEKSAQLGNVSGAKALQEYCGRR